MKLCGHFFLQNFSKLIHLAEVSSNLLFNQLLITFIILNVDFALYFSETVLIVSLALASILASFCLGLGCLIPKNRKENNNQEVELQDENSLILMNILHDEDKGGLISEFFSPRFLA